MICPSNQYYFPRNPTPPGRPKALSLDPCSLQRTHDLCNVLCNSSTMDNCLCPHQSWGDNRDSPVVPLRMLGLYMNVVLQRSRWVQGVVTSLTSCTEVRQRWHTFPYDVNKCCKAPNTCLLTGHSGLRTKGTHEPIFTQETGNLSDVPLRQDLVPFVLRQADFRDSQHGTCAGSGELALLAYMAIDHTLAHCRGADRHREGRAAHPHIRSVSPAVAGMQCRLACLLPCSLLCGGTQHDTVIGPQNTVLSAWFVTAGSADRTAQPSAER